MESGPLFRWSKRVPEKEVETWENRLTIEGLPYVVEKAVGRERWQFNVYGGDRDELDSLRHRLGGGVVRVRPEDWQPTASDEPVRLKIRDRLLVVEETETEDLARLGMEFPGREILAFPPQMAFGTGGHQTTATCLLAMIGNGHEFDCGRQFAAWLGLVPGQYSSGGKSRLGRITKAGDAYLRSLLVLGARAVLNAAANKADSLSRWAMALRQRRGYWKAVVAIAAKNARMAWAVLTKGESFKLPA